MKALLIHKNRHPQPPSERPVVVVLSISPSHTPSATTLSTGQDNPGVCTLLQHASCDILHHSPPRLNSGTSSSRDVVVVVVVFSPLQFRHTRKQRTCHHHTKVFPSCLITPLPSPPLSGLPHASIISLPSPTAQDGGIPVVVIAVKFFSKQLDINSIARRRDQRNRLDIVWLQGGGL